MRSPITSRLLPVKDAKLRLPRRAPFGKAKYAPGLYRGYSILDMAASSVEYNFPSRVAPTENGRTNLVAKNIDLNVQRLGINQTDTNNSSYSPTSWSILTSPGQEYADGLNKRSTMISPNVSGQSGRVAVLKEMYGAAMSSTALVQAVTPLPMSPLSFTVLDYFQTTTSGASDAVVVGIAKDKSCFYGSKFTNVLYQSPDGQSGTWTAVHTFPAGQAITNFIELDNGEALVLCNLVGGTAFESAGFASSHTSATWTQVATAPSGGYFRGEWGGAHATSKSGPIHVMSTYGRYATNPANGSPDATATTIVVARQAYGAAFQTIFDAQVQFPTHGSLSTYGACVDKDNGFFYVTMGNSGPFGAGLTTLLRCAISDAFANAGPWTQIPLPTEWAGNTGTWWQSPAVTHTQNALHLGSEGDNGIYTFPKLPGGGLGPGFVQLVGSGHGGSNIFPGGFNQNARGERWYYGSGNANAGPDCGAAIYADQLDEGRTWQEVWRDDAFKGSSYGTYQVFGPNVNGIVAASVGAPGGTGAAAWKMLRAKLIVSPLGTSERYGNLTGDGATTVFTFPHFLPSAPTTMTCLGQNEVSRSLVPSVTVDATNITLTFASAPTNATAYSYKLLYSNVVDPATTSWVNAVTGAGGTVSATQQLRVNTLIVALKAHGLFNTAVQRLWLAAGESVSQQATIDIVNLASLTLHGTETLAAGGYTGDGSTGYFDSGFNPSTGSGVTADSLHVLAYNRTSRAATAVNKITFGGNDGSRFTYLQDTGGSMGWDVNGGTFPSFAVSNVQGFYGINRTGSTQSSLLKNGAAISTKSDSRTAAMNANIYLGAYNNGGTAQKWSADQFAAWSIGAGLTTQQMSDLSNDLNAYMTAWGVNVY